MAWLWLWPAAATLIQPLAWELPDAAGMALKKQNLYTHTHNTGFDAKGRIYQVSRKIKQLQI